MKDRSEELAGTIDQEPSLKEVAALLRQVQDNTLEDAVRILEGHAPKELLDKVRALKWDTPPTPEQVAWRAWREKENAARIGGPCPKECGGIVAADPPGYWMYCPKCKWAEPDPMGG